MGAYQFQAQNPPVMEGGRRSPVPGDGGGDKSCRCAAIHLAPRFLRPLVARVLPPTTTRVTESDLHPNVDRIVSALLELRDTTSEATATNGRRIQIAFTKQERVGDDYRCDLRIQIDGSEVFVGKFVAHGVWRRGKVSFAHTVVGAIELLYLQFLELSATGGDQVQLRLGVIDLVGTATDLPTATAMVEDEISAALRRQQTDPGGGSCDPGAFDPLAIYGALPSSGYGYFQGTGTALAEQRLQR